MSGQDQRCGTCKWWARNVDFPRIGDCDFKLQLPAAFDLGDFWKSQTHELGGATCPCWEQKL